MTTIGHLRGGAATLDPMGFVTNDPKKSDEQQPGATGLIVDLGLMSCPECRREVPEWQDDCPDCGVRAVPRASLGSQVPDVPAHLLGDDDDDDDDDTSSDTDG